MSQAFDDGFNTANGFDIYYKEAGYNPFKLSAPINLDKLPLQAKAILSEKNPYINMYSTKSDRISYNIGFIKYFNSEFNMEELNTVANWIEAAIACDDNQGSSCRTCPHMGVTCKL